MLRHFLLMSLILVSTLPFAPNPILPVTGLQIAYDYYSILPATLPPSRLNQFIDQVANNGNARTVAGIYHPEYLQAPVIQQPKNAPGFVSSEEDLLTQFRMANQYGVTALLAHNYLAGQAFFEFQTGDILTIVYGNGNTQDYRVEEILRYQALTPNSPYSKFIDLSDPSRAVVTATDLFYKIYTNRGSLVLQTCIEKDGELSWGRLFVVAAPIDPYEYLLSQ